MKTAMQELIERLKRNIEEMPNEKNQFTQGYKAGLSFVIERATNSLEKEKEQIRSAHSHHRCVNDQTMECTIKAYENAEQYYNQTYKPETI